MLTLTSIALSWIKPKGNACPRHPCAIFSSNLPFSHARALNFRGDPPRTALKFSARLSRPPHEHLVKATVHQSAAMASDGIEESLGTVEPSIDIAALQIHQEEASVKDTAPISRDEAKTESEVGTCYFLDKIPGELRNRIYEYALVGQDGEAVLKYCILVPSQSAVTKGKSREPRRKHLEQEIFSGMLGIEPAKPDSFFRGSPFAVEGGRIGKEREAFTDENNIFALSRTCKQIHEECSGLVYEYNKVKFVAMPFSNEPSMQLKHIAARQAESGELQEGVIIDAGEFDCTHASTEIDSYIVANQESLRKLRKSCKSLALHFHITDMVLPPEYRTQRDQVVCKLVIDSPESVVAQVDAMLVAEPQRLNARSFRFVKTRLIKTFWPLWAVRNIL
ncbi:hypothetical protein HII31_03424 [Pseudocercospora fuligena]|uniref:Uncharacterized protein n=1 Tax=Pseudocercospora fuligena TaxID=685502 RepID=A0A8H6RQT0_9PEZI|nr:hypothetical protein HII31_03424 [Pseudocercospora fuligena]